MASQWGLGPCPLPPRVSPARQALSAACKVSVNDGDQALVLSTFEFKGTQEFMFLDPWICGLPLKLWAGAGWGVSTFIASEGPCGPTPVRHS